MENTGTVAENGDSGFDYSIPARIAALDTTRGIVLCLALIAAPAAFSFNMTSFLHAKEAVLCGGLVLMAFLVLLRGRFYWNGVKAFAPLWVFLGLGLARSALLPTAVASDSALNVLRWSMVLVMGALAYDLLAQNKWRARILDAFVLSAVVVGLLGCIQFWGVAPKLFPVFESYDQRVYSVFGNQDYFGGYIAMALPAALYRTGGSQRRWWAYPALALLVPALLVSGSRSAWLAAAAGLLVIAPHLEWRPRRLAAPALLMAVAAAATALAAPEATVARLQKAFAQHDEGRDTRIWLWKAGHGMFRDYPLLGAGLGNYAYWSPKYLGEIAAAKPQDPAFQIERHADQPHSEPVRILAEAGLIGVLLWIWMATRLVGARGPQWGILAAFAVFALFNGVFDSVPHTLAAVLMAGMMTSKSRVAFWESKSAASVLSLAAIAVCLGEILAVITPSVWLSAAEDAQLAGRPSLVLYERAANYAWPSARAHKQYADALAGAGREQEAYGEFLKALKGLDTGDIYLAMATIAVEQDNLPAARHWIQRCVRRWPHNSEAREMFFLLYHREPI